MAHRILLLGTGMIATSHAEAFAALPGCKIVACVDVVPGRAAEFGKKHRIGRAFDSLAAALDWGDFTAAINATPDAVHHATTMDLLAAGKHVFCEKPLAPTYPEALQMAVAAESAGLINMVNLTYRNSPALQRAREMVLAGAIGDIRHVEAAYRQSWLVSRAWGDWRITPGWLWRLSQAHGSTGVLGDVGVHILDFASYGAGQDFVRLSADLPVFPKAAGDKVGDYTLDANDSALLLVGFGGGARGTVLATRYATGNANELTLALHGTMGAIRVETDGRRSALFTCLGENIDAHAWVAEDFPPVPTNSQRFAAALGSGVNGAPSFRRAAEIQRVIDAAFVSAAEGRAVDLAG